MTSREIQTLNTSLYNGTMSACYSLNGMHFKNYEVLLDKCRLYELYHMKYLNFWINTCPYFWLSASRVCVTYVSRSHLEHPVYITGLHELLAKHSFSETKKMCVNLKLHSNYSEPLSDSPNSGIRFSFAPRFNDVPTLAHDIIHPNFLRPLSANSNPHLVCDSVTITMYKCAEVERKTKTYGCT